MSYFNRFCVSYLQFADNEELQSEWREAKRRNKIKVASFLKEKTGYFVDPDAMFDVQVIPWFWTLFFVLLGLFCFNWIWHHAK